MFDSRTRTEHLFLLSNKNLLSRVCGVSEYDLPKLDFGVLSGGAGGQELVLLGLTPNVFSQPVHFLGQVLQPFRFIRLEVLHLGAHTCTHACVRKYTTSTTPTMSTY